MSKAQQIAKLEKLLTRVSQRASEPRPVRAVARAVPSAAESMVRSVPPPSSAPTAAPTAMPVRSMTPAPAPAPTSAVPSRAPAAPAPAASSASDLPDLDFVEATAPSGEKRTSLVPSGEESEQEFDIPAHGAPSRVQPVQAIDLEAAPGAAEPIEIDRAPLAVMTIPPASAADEHALEVEGPARVPMAGAIPSANTLTDEDVEEIEPEPSAQHIAAGPQRYASHALPATETTRVVAMSPPTRARTFRDLVARTLALKPRR
jgi:hypothetical protein